MTWRLTFDPLAENATNRPLDVVNETNGLAVASVAFPAPPQERAMAGSIESVGDSISARKYANRTIPIVIAVSEPDDTAATNLIANPSFEAGVTGWVTTGIYGLTAGASTAIVATPLPVSGDSVLRVITTNAAVSEGAGTTFAATAGVTYTATVYVRGNAGGETLTLVIGGPIGTAAANIETDTNFTATTDWVRVTATITAIVSGTCTVAVRTQTATVRTFFLDAAQTEAAATATAYFDGDTPGCAWAGTPNNSASTRPAAGGARFDAILADLRAAVAKQADRGGTLRYINTAGVAYTFDVIAVDTYDPNLDQEYFFGATTISVQLLARPRVRGAHQTVTLTSAGLTGLYSGVAVDVPGELPATGTMIVTDATVVFGGQQHRAWWGYESAVTFTDLTAVYEAEAQTIVHGTATADATAAGGNMVRYAPPALGPYDIITLTGSHTGAYRVFARAKTPEYLQIEWTSANGTATNAAFKSGAGAGDYDVFDLGLLVAPSGWWTMTVRYIVTFGTPTLDLDRVWLIPVTDGYGAFEYGPAPRKYFNLTESSATVGSATVDTYQPDRYSGDMLAVPPSGPERRQLRVVAKIARDVQGDTGIDATDVTLDLIPNYLTVT